MAQRNSLTTVSGALDSVVDDRSAEEIRQDIVARRDQISRTVDLIEDEVARKLDWREYVSQHPIIAISAAAGVGLLLSSLFKPRPTAAERIIDALAEGVEDITYRLQQNLDDFGQAKSAFVTQTAKAAAVALITSSANKFLTGKPSTHNRRRREFDSSSGSDA